ncbi:MAG TPA: polymorphic toxin type 10 domain-containing protein, partial [Steroidobacteraceae bacterium]|nr:polymorphic toxin type 10 domain-containing protein [Steroidobacteraceae bacterium]
LTRQQVEPGDPRWQVTIDLAYDAFGNNSRRTVTGVGMAPRITTVGWDARGRFPVALTNPLYETTAIAWEEGAGVPVSLTDTNGLTTRWAYDSFGRLLRETRPDGTRSTWSRASCGAECDPRARYSLRHDEQDAAGSLTRSILTDVDRFDRSLRVATRMPGGAYAEEVVGFDSHGRVASRSVPYWSGGSSPASWHYDHDGLGRLTAASLRSAGGSVERSLSYDHDALAVTSSDGLGHQSTRRWTAWGDLVSVTDALGGTSRYQHSAFGELLRVDDALGNTTSKIAYNVRGMKTGQFDMDLGAWSIFPNALGEVVAWTDAKAQTTTVSYDLLGRPLSRMETEGVTRWTWGASRAARNVGRLAAVSSPGYSESYIYDSLARLASRRISSDAAYEFSYAYDAAGQLETLTYPASTAGFRLQVGYEYEQGQPVRIVDRSAPGTALWRLGATDAAGNVIDETLGAAVRVVSGFSPLTGLIEYRWASAGGGAPAQDLSYRWDAAGNLLERRDRSRNLNETFGYDAENRLDATMLNGATSVSLGYDLLGNILWKSDVCQTASGCYSYDATRRHAVTKAGSHSYGYDANGNMTSRNGSSIAWYSYNLPRTLAAPGGNLSQFWYGPLRNRWKQVATSAGSNETTVYVGGLVEKVMRGGSTVWRHYVQGPAGTIAIHLRYGDGSPARTWYRTHDHLGSTDRIVDGTTGAAIVSESFDAFGRRRGNDGTMYLATSDWAAIRSTTRDGFTGHEHLDNLGLVHMNGRVYDPVIARFLSADPVIQDPYYGQDLNRYSYAWNNPLSVIDPSGLEEVRCMHGPDGRCQGVTVTGLREGRGLGGSSAAYQLWRSGSNGQAASAAQRDPCGQDGSAMACAGAGRREAAGSTPPAVAPGQADWRSLESWSGLGRASLDLVPGWYYAGQAASALANGDHVSAVAFWGAMTADVFLFGRGSAATQATRVAASPIPTELARVVTGERTLTTLGRPGATDVCVVAAEDIAGLNSAELARRLTIPSSETFTVIRFPTPSSGVASPVFRTNVGFLEGGRTRGGAREFVIPNGPVPVGARIEVVGP